MKSEMVHLPGDGERFDWNCGGDETHATVNFYETRFDMTRDTLLAGGGSD